MKFTRAVVLAVALLKAVGSTSQGLLYVANPQTDAIPDGTDISTYYAFLTLSSSHSGSDTAVYATESPFSGNMVFGYDEGFGPDPRWHFATWMQGNFSAPVDLVELDFEADTTVTLSIFDAANNLLGTTNAAGSMMSISTLSLSDPNIAYFRAEATFRGNDQSEFAEIRYNVVPEPFAVGLFAAGALAITVLRRRGFLHR